MIQEKQLELWPSLPKGPPVEKTRIKAQQPQNKKPAPPRGYLSDEELSKAKRERGESHDEEKD